MPDAYKDCILVAKAELSAAHRSLTSAVFAPTPRTRTPQSGIESR
ncbi:MAG: hypothetical protein AAF360_16760 [Pseudomonadota bacterium]